MDFYSIIPAGGGGTRLWPISTPARPKFLLDLVEPSVSLLQSTVSRLRDLSAGQLIVTGQSHEQLVTKQVEQVLDASSYFEVIAEPSGRDSMAAIGLAAAILHHRHGSVLVGSFAADHVIKDTAVFQACVRQAMRGAEAGYLTTIAITPQYPATGFGYIKSGDLLESRLAPGGQGMGLPEAAPDRPQLSQPVPQLCKVQEFREKPDAQTAARYLEEGGYWWNAGMFVTSTKTLLEALERLHPRMGAGIKRIAKHWDGSRRQEVLDEIWPTLPKVPIDLALAEPLAAQGKVATVVAPPGMGWDDIGDFEALRRIWAPEDRADNDLVNLSSQVQVFALDSPGGLVSADGLKSVAIVGIANPVVVVHEGNLLVTTLEHAQQVKAVSQGAMRLR